MDLDIHVLSKGKGAYTVILKGILNKRNSGLCWRQLESILNPETKALHLDMDMLSYMDSMGLRVVLNVKKLIEGRGGQFQMLNMQPQIMTLMDIVVGPAARSRLVAPE